MKAYVPFLALVLGCNFQAGTTYEVQGTVLDVQEGSVVVDHEEIPGFMDAMVMPFNADPNLIKNLKRGDRIEANFLVSENSSQLIGIEVVGQVELPPPAPVEVQPLKVGETLTAMTLSSHRGPLKLGAGQGVTTVLSFLFTSCPVPEFCPLLATKLVGLQEIIGDSARIVVVTLDPERDTFEALVEYGKAVGADPNAWHYVREDIDALAPLFDAVEMTLFERDGELMHSLKLLVLNPEGKLMFLAKNNGWDPNKVAAAVTEANQ